MDEVLKRLVVRIAYEVDKGSREQVEGDQTRTQSKAVAIGQIAAAAVTKAAELGVRAVKALASAVTDAVEGFADLSGEIADTAQSAGVTTDEMQRLRYAAKLSGVEASALTGGLRELNKGMSEAATKGTGPFAEGLGLVGVSLRELEGLTAEQRLGLLGDALRDIEDPSARSAAALKLFGGQGDAVLRLAQQGSEGIGQLTAKAEALGLVLDRDTIAKGEELGDTLDTLSAQATVAAARVGSYLAPMYTRAAERAGAWAQANRSFLEQDLPAAIEAVVVAGGSMLAWLADTISEFRNFGREVGHAYERVAELATSLREELQPAIDTVAQVATAWADAFVAVNSAIGDGIATVLDYIGVLDTLKSAWDSLPFVGESIDEMTARLHGGGLVDTVNRAAAAASGGRVAPEAGAGRAARDAAWAAAIANVNDVAAEIAARGDAERGTVDRSAARAAYRRSLANKGKGGGASSAGGPSSGDILDRMWGSVTGEDAGSSWWSSAAAAIGIGGGPLPMGGGGGSSPLAGAQFSRVDASFTATTTVQITIPESVAAMGAAHLATTIADEVAVVVEDRARQAAEHYASTARRL